MKIQTAFRLEEDVMNYLKDVAKSNDRTVSNLVGLILREWVRARVEAAAKSGKP